MDDRDEQLPAHPTGEGHRPRLGGEDRCRGRDRDVDPAVARPERCVGRVEPPDHRSRTGQAHVPTCGAGTKPRRSVPELIGDGPRAGEDRPVRVAINRGRPTPRTPQGPPIDDRETTLGDRCDANRDAVHMSGDRLLGLDELQPELTDRLRVDLADPRFRHTEDVADLGEGESLEVIQGDDDLLAFG